MDFFGLNDNELFIELIGENGDDGLHHRIDRRGCTAFRDRSVIKT